MRSRRPGARVRRGQGLEPGDGSPRTTCAVGNSAVQRRQLSCGMQLASLKGSWPLSPKLAPMSTFLGGSDLARTPFIGVLGTVPGRLSNRANRPPAGSGARHRRTRALDRSGLRGRAAGREATGVWLLQHRHGNRTSFQSGIRLLAFARVSKQEGCGGGQECDRNCGGGRRASVALRIRSPKHCPAGR